MSAWVEMADYEVEGVAKIRAAIPGLEALSDRAVAGMYSWWSEEEMCAGWMSMDGGLDPDFIDWVKP